MDNLIFKFDSPENCKKFREYFSIELEHLASLIDIHPTILEQFEQGKLDSQTITMNEALEKLYFATLNIFANVISNSLEKDNQSQTIH